MANCQRCGQEVPEGQALCENCARAGGEAQTATAVDTSRPPYFQPAFTQQPAARPFVPPAQTAFRIPLTLEQLPEEYKPLGAWTYFLYMILFSLPLIGFICLIVFACGGTRNINLRNFARSYFCAYLVVLILAVLAVALIVGLGIQMDHILSSVVQLF